MKSGVGAVVFYTSLLLLGLLAHCVTSFKYIDLCV